MLHDHLRPHGRIDLGLLVLRVIVGAIFIAHGGQKLFIFGMEGVAGAFANMGVPLAALAGPAVALTEFFGGLALAAGFLTRIVAPALAVIMLGAMFFVHISNGFFLPRGIEFVLTLFGGATALALAGAGCWSVDGYLATRRDGKRVEDDTALRRSA